MPPNLQTPPRGRTDSCLDRARAKRSRERTYTTTKTNANLRSRPPRAAYGFAMLYFQLSSEKREFPFSPATLEQQVQKQQLYATAWFALRQAVRAAAPR